MRSMNWCIVLFLTGWSFMASAAEVKTQKTKDGWQLFVDGKPFFIKGMCYSPTAIGESSDDNTRRNWMMVDDDGDGRNDYAYQTWVDVNRNNYHDLDEKEVGDFELMRQMGVNCIRVYHHVSGDPELQKLNASCSKLQNYPPEKEVKILRQLHSRYGIRVAMGDFLGSYTVGTGAGWEAGTDYTDPVQRARMLKSVEEMVRVHKDEPYILLWILGNENDLQRFTHTNASLQPEVYARFVNEAAALIKKIDGHHPVAVCNATYKLLDYYAKYTPAVDIFGINMYRDYGFNELWQKVANIYDRPVVLTEFGQGRPLVVRSELLEDAQSLVYRRSWEDISHHRAGREKPGNSIGGFVFEWVDQWWTNGDKWNQNTNADPQNAGWNQEYCGVTSLGDGSTGSLTRQLRRAYWVFKKLWKED